MCIFRCNLHKDIEQDASCMKLNKVKCTENLTNLCPHKIKIHEKIQLSNKSKMCRTRLR